MSVNLKELCQQDERLASGHKLCAGCGEPIIIRHLLHAIPGPVVLANATGCLEISTSMFPYTSWRVPWIHSAFENAAATISGVEAAYRSLVRQGKMEDKGITFVAVAGDGGTYDIGLQALSGALERGHRFINICLNNEAYMNTGIQRSGATLKGTWTTTSPVGKVVPGKRENRKDLTQIVVAHNIPYAAQASPHFWKDLLTKMQKAASVNGPSFINVLSPCPRGWRTDPAATVSLTKLAVETCLWPLYEVIEGEWKLNYRPTVKKPITEWLQVQGRFAHLMRPGNEHVIEEIQQDIDLQWEKLKQRCGVA